jgi:hypothetical protein
MLAALTRKLVAIPSRRVCFGFIVLTATGANLLELPVHVIGFSLSS